MWEERIAPGAFDDALKKADVRALFNHDPNCILGRTTAKTLTLRSTKAGLEYDVPDLPKSRADVTGGDPARRRDREQLLLRAGEGQRRGVGGSVEGREAAPPHHQADRQTVRRRAGGVPGVRGHEASSARCEKRARELAEPKPAAPTVDVEKERELLRLAEAE